LLRLLEVAFLAAACMTGAHEHNPAHAVHGIRESM
jgi:hypothetical protein